jgi:hypothetical protein
MTALELLLWGAWMPRQRALQSRARSAGRARARIGAGFTT